jgi:hypothetical protein
LPDDPYTIGIPESLAKSELLTDRIYPLSKILLNPYGSNGKHCISPGKSIRELTSDGRV